jgi:hypothetical protein
VVVLNLIRFDSIAAVSVFSVTLFANPTDFYDFERELSTVLAARVNLHPTRSLTNPQVGLTRFYHSQELSVDYFEVVSLQTIRYHCWQLHKLKINELSPQKSLRSS